MIGFLLSQEIIQWLLFFSLLAGVWFSSPYVMRRRGRTIFGRFESEMHSCRLPSARTTRTVRIGTKWRCDHCKRLWQLGATRVWVCLPDDSMRRITELERELGISSTDG